MSLPRPSGLKAPSKIGKPTGLPQPKSGIPATEKAKSAIAKSARAAGISATQADKYANTLLGKLPGPEVEFPPPPSDDFKIGDRVWVGGTKPGVIAYLGETQFAAGEWAGVVLDKPEGKNDGSVKGVRYFQCEPDRGVFARISKLSRTPGLIPPVAKPEDAMSEAASNKPNGMLKRPTTPSMTPSKGAFGSNTSMNRSTPVSVVKPGSKPPLKIGDRVLVSGSKMGTLQYIGETDFAKGEWAGVELDEKQGKNDGAVAGKRYFECKPMFGLFAPVHKVTRLTSGAGPGKVTTPSSQSRSLMSTSLRLSKERSGSQESVSSISSSASSVSRSRVRLGVTSLGNQLPLRQQRKKELSSTPLSAKPGHRPSTLNITATTSALQKALKEKEEHIEQLLKERDLERSEVARAAAQVDEAESQMSMMRMEQERYKNDVDDTVIKLRSLVDDLKQERAELSNQLDVERRKVEDLQFQIEEESMMKDDLESRTEEDDMRLRDSERLMQREKERADKLEQELYAMKAMAKDSTEKLASTEELNLSYLDQIEEITHKLSQAENKIKSYESNRLEEGAKTSQVSIELEEKESKVVELEEILTSKNKQVKQLSNQLQEVEEDLLMSREKNNQLQSQVDKVTSQLDNQSKASETFNIELQQLKTQISDLQRKLDSSDEKAKRLSDEKNQIEQQMSDMMRNSGDSSKRLSILTEQLQDRNRKIQDLQADLSNSTQQSAKLREEKDRLRKEAEKERENISVKHNDVVNTIKLTLQDVQKELSKSNNKMTAMKEDFEKEKEEAMNRKNTEINSLRKTLDQCKADLDKQEVQTQAHKQVLDKLNMETEALKFEKEKSDKMVKRLEGEKDSINTDLIHIRVTNSKVQLEYEKMVDEKNKLLQQIKDLQEDKDRVSDSKSTIQHKKEELESEKTKLSEEKDQINRELVESRASLQQKDILLEELQKEVEKLKTDLSQKEESLSQQSQSQSRDLQSQIEKGQSRVKELEGMLQSEITQGEKKVKDLEKKLLTQTSESDQRYNQLEALFKEVEDERDTMKAQLEFSNLVAEERRRLEEQNMQMNQEMEKAEESHRKEIENLENVKMSLQQEVANLKNENASLEKYRQTVEKKEVENKDLTSQINSLRSQLQSKEVNSNSIANQVEDKQPSTDSQVDFLNSVIVDLQKKNQDLKSRLEAMEAGVITNGEADSSMEEAGDSRKPPPRLFCDICDVFDQHDTEDCPCQAMDYEDDTPSPSHHHGDRKQTRPYCDICEEFHEPCENLQISVPQGNGQQSTEPKVRYHSGSESVSIEDSALWSIFDMLPSESDGGQTVKIGHKNKEAEDTKQKDNAKLSERIPVYDDADIDEYGIMHDSMTEMYKSDCVDSEVIEEIDKTLKTGTTDDAYVRDDENLPMDKSSELANENDGFHDNTDCKSDLARDIQDHDHTEDKDEHESESAEDVICHAKSTMKESASGCDNVKTDDRIFVDVKDAGNCHGDIDTDSAITKDKIERNTEFKTTLITEHEMLDQNSSDTEIDIPANNEATADSDGDDKMCHETEHNTVMTREIKDNLNGEQTFGNEKGSCDSNIEIMADERVDCDSSDNITDNNYIENNEIISNANENQMNDDVGVGANVYSHEQDIEECDDEKSEENKQMLDDETESKTASSKNGMACSNVDKQTMHDERGDDDVDFDNRMENTNAVTNHLGDDHRNEDKDDNNTPDTDTTEDSDTYSDTVMNIGDDQSNDPNSEAQCQEEADEQESEKIHDENQTCADECLNTQEVRDVDSSLGFTGEIGQDNESINTPPGPVNETNDSGFDNTTIEDSGNRDSCKIT